MAINAGMAWEVRTTSAGDTNGGGFRNADNLATPTAPTVNATGNGSVALNTYYVVVCYVSAYGREGPKSAQTSIVVNDASNDTIVTTSPAASTGAVNYHVYMGTVSGGPYFANPGTDVAIGTNSSRTTTPATSGTQPPGTDYSQQNSAQIAVTDGVTAGTTTITSATAAFTPAHVGNVMYVQGGTGSITAGWYEITAYTSATAVVVDRSTGLTAGTGVTLNLGGGLLTISKAVTLAVTGNRVYVKSGTYTETVTANTVTNAGPLGIIYIGYASTHGDTPTRSTRPLIDGQSTRANCIVTSNGPNSFTKFNFTGATSDNVSLTGFSHLYECRSYSSGRDGVRIAGQYNLIYNVETDSNTGAGVTMTTMAPLVGVYSHDNTSYGVVSANNQPSGIVASVIESNANHNIYVAYGFIVYASTIYGAVGASSDGVLMADSYLRSAVIGNVVAGNGRYGVSRSTGGISFFVDYNAYYNNTTAALNNVPLGPNDVSGTDPQFVDAPNGDFRIGTNLKALGWPGVFPGGLSTGYMDPGAVQRVEPAGGSGVILPNMDGGMRG